jgi:hypothetical protein
VCRKENDLRRMKVEDAKCFVYLQMVGGDMEELRHRYLKYVGGQCTVFCQTHRVPMVTSVTRGKGFVKMQCCNVKNQRRCKRNPDLECPVPKCQSCVCSKCKKVFMAEDDIVFVESHNDATVVVDSALQNEAGDGSTELACDSNVEDVNDGDSCNESAGEEEFVESLHYTTLHHGIDQTLFDVEHINERGNVETLECNGEEHGNILMSTHETKSGVELEFDMACMGTGVMLNKFGTVLVRKDSQLQASCRERNLVERVVSVNDVESVPLVYLEGMLFPSIFWSQPNGGDGGLLGAMPTAFLCRHQTRRKYNITSLIKHARLRLKMTASTVGSNPNYLAFLFDALANGALEGCDTRVVLRRGFEEQHHGAGVKVRNVQDDLFTDIIDNRQHCHNLAASEADKPSSVFVTMTCNMAEHFGVKNIKRYIDSVEALENYKAFIREKFVGFEDLTGNEEREVKESSQEAARILLVWNWMEVKAILIDYLMHSPEEPLGGKPDKLFCRDE